MKPTTSAPDTSHELKGLPKLLTAPFHNGDTFLVGRARMLTIQGLARLVRHVINEYIERKPKVKTEVYDYRPERAGGWWQSPLRPSTGSAGLKT